MLGAPELVEGLYSDPDPSRTVWVRAVRQRIEAIYERKNESG